MRTHGELTGHKYSDYQLCKGGGRRRGGAGGTVRSSREMQTRANPRTGYQEVFYPGIGWMPADQTPGVDSRLGSNGKIQLRYGNKWIDGENDGRSEIYRDGMVRHSWGGGWVKLEGYKSKAHVEAIKLAAAQNRGDQELRDILDAPRKTVESYYLPRLKKSFGL